MIKAVLPEEVPPQPKEQKKHLLPDSTTVATTVIERITSTTTTRASFTIMMKGSRPDKSIATDFLLTNPVPPSHASFHRKTWTQILFIEKRLSAVLADKFPPAATLQVVHCRDELHDQNGQANAN